MAYEREVMATKVAVYINIYLSSLASVDVVYLLWMERIALISKLEAEMILLETDCSIYTC
jgi:hypothetical protein